MENEIKAQFDCTIKEIKGQVLVVFGAWGMAQRVLSDR